MFVDSFILEIIKAVYCFTVNLHIQYVMGLYDMYDTKEQNLEKGNSLKQII